MYSIQNLFEDIQNDVPKKYKKRTSKKCVTFKGFEESLPEFKFPEEGSDKFEEDLDEVRRCVRNPSLGAKFLDKSHKKSEDIFKRFLKDEEIPWDKVSKIADEFDGVITRLKFKYNRSRPKEFFISRDEDLDVKDSSSPSFPSGHTAFAYLLCDFLSNLIPHRQKDLEKIAELIGQSRLENGVHFPTDVQAGRFIGEQAAKYVLQNNRKVSEGIMTKNQKSFVSFLRERAHEIRPAFESIEALRLYTSDMSVFMSETLRINEDTCYEASKRFISGYKIKECSDSEEIKNFFEGLCFVYHSDQQNVFDILRLNKLLEGKTILRTFEKSTITGRKYSSVRNIKEFISKIDKFNEKPFIKMAVFNWLSPFESGNEKITNILLLKETGFNFDITNQMLTDEIGTLLEDFYEANDMKMLLS
jgi:hypothetical protein